MSGKPHMLVLGSEYSPKTSNVVMQQKKHTEENYLPVKLMAAFSIEPIISLKKHFDPIGLQNI